jgi:DNA-binding transcriptional MerR regulator
MVGMTVTQLRYLDRLGLVVPHYRGAHRRYGPDAMERLRLIKGLLGSGYKPGELRAALRFQDALPVRPMTGKQILTRLLLEAATAREPVLLPAGTTRDYNTAYKAVGRLSGPLGLRVRRSKMGDTLQVHAEPA